MKRSWYFIILLHCLPLAADAQETFSTTASAGEEGKQTTETYAAHPSGISYGAKCGFTSSLFRVSDFSIEGTGIDEVQNTYKIGYFASLFMRIHLDKHFLQPEISYNINRCDVSFQKPNALEGDIASIRSSLHSIDIPILYGYNIVKESPYSLAVFGGPKLRYIWGKKSDIIYENFNQQNIHESLHPFNISFTLGVNVAISHIFFDFRYDIGLNDISKSITHDTYPDKGATGSTQQISLKRKENVLSFSLGVLF